MTALQFVCLTYTVTGTPIIQGCALYYLKISDIVPEKGNYAVSTYGTRLRLRDVET